MKPCNNGHYYDQDKHNNCPYCSDSNSGLSDIEDSSGTEHVPNKTSSRDGATEIYNKKPEEKKSDDGATQMFFAQGTPVATGEASEESTEPVQIAGWIVITSEKGKGNSFLITYGMNTIGRSSENHINIENGDGSISRLKHTSIIYDFENNQFFIQHHDGKYLTYLNKKLVGGLTELSAYDKIKIGKTEFVFVPLCGEHFQWEDKDEQD